jgi:hypothetical protein
MQWLIPTLSQPIQGQRLRQHVTGKSKRGAANDHSRQLIKQQQGCQSAFRLALPALQPAGQDLLNQRAKRLAGMIVLALLLGKPQRRTTGCCLSNRYASGAATAYSRW